MGRGIVHKKTGVKIENAFGKTYVTASLPRLLFSTNKKLIVSQKQVDDALEKADSLVAQVSTVGLPAKRVAFSRIDLTWQIIGNVKDVIYSLLNFEYPRVRKAPRIYMGESILFTNRNFSLSIYDKEREVNKRRKTPGHILRIELRLQTPAIQERFKTKALTNLNFLECYEIYQKAVLKLCIEPHPRLTSLNQIYKYAIENKWEINGMPAFNFMVKDLKTEKRIRRAVSRLRLRMIGIDLEKEFPPKIPNRVKTTKRGFDFSAPPFRFNKKRRPVKFNFKKRVKAAHKSPRKRA